jgi:pimeloyl-ACP methyl ester carboxylesterase
VGGRLADDEVKTVAELVKDLDPNALLGMIGKLGDDDIMAIMALLQGTVEPNTLYTKDDIDMKLTTSSIPILGIAGTNDPSRQNLENLQKRLQELKVESRLTLVMIDKANHLNTPNRPEFLKAIQDFLKANPAR